MQAGLIAVVFLVVFGLVSALMVSRSDVRELKLALKHEDELNKKLQEAREADQRALATLMEAEQEARRAIDERQKYIDTIHGAIDHTGLLDALRVFGKAVCEYDPSTRRVTCADAAPGGTGGAKDGEERGGVDGSGGKTD